MATRLFLLLLQCCCYRGCLLWLLLVHLGSSSLLQRAIRYHDTVRERKGTRHSSAVVQLERGGGTGKVLQRVLEPTVNKDG